MPLQPALLSRRFPPIVRTRCAIPSSMRSASPAPTRSMQGNCVTSTKARKASRCVRCRRWRTCSRIRGSGRANRTRASPGKSSCTPNRKSGFTRRCRRAAASRARRASPAWDKGENKGAFLQQTRDIADADTGRLLATVVQLSLLRGDGGFGDGGSTDPLPTRTRCPTARQTTCELATPAQLALIYRLSGDLNPLHADPAVASAAGFRARSCTAWR